MRTALIIPAAGSGTRLGAQRPKAFVPLAGEPMLAHAIRGALESDVVDTIVVAVPAEQVEETHAIVARVRERAADRGETGTPHAHVAGPSTSTARSVRIDVVVGGVERVASVAAGLAVTPDADRVLVHDAARCLTPPELFGRVVDALGAGASAVVPVLPVTDTIKSAAADGSVTGDLERARLRRVQTPQGFTREVLVAAHDLERRDPDPNATDDAGLVERLGVQVRAVAGDEAALKITHPMDMRIAELYLTAQEGVRGE